MRFTYNVSDILDCNSLHKIIRFYPPMNCKISSKMCALLKTEFGNAKTSVSLPVSGANILNIMEQVISGIFF